VASKLQLEWSPRQIAGWLKRTYPDDETYQVSHETIYRTLFIQARGALKKELLQHLRRTRRMRRSRHHTHKTADRGQITDVVSIRERPAEAEDRAVPGHWEGDLLFGSKNSQIATLVERHSRYLLLARVKSKADHKRFTLDTNIQVYFCDPKSPWQRGSNENTNGLLRQYFPKGMDLSNVHQNRLNAIARRLNERPRETLNFETPAERFNQCVASTG
jgi:IS30 family transposase